MSIQHFKDTFPHASLDKDHLGVWFKLVGEACKIRAQKEAEGDPKKIYQVHSDITKEDYEDAALLISTQNMNYNLFLSELFIKNDIADFATLEQLREDVSKIHKLKRYLNAYEQQIQEKIEKKL